MVAVAAQARHLVRRFGGHLRSRPLTAAELAWVAEQLSPQEWELWQRHRPQDRRHTLGVAQAVLAAIPPAATIPSWVTPAALLHYIGKTLADLSVVGRVTASLLKAARLRSAPGPLGRYLRYPALGSALLGTAGSHPLVVAWAAGHHHRPTPPTVPASWAAHLAAADHAAV